MAKVCRAWVSLYLCELGGGVHGINTDDISAWDYICMCTSQVPIIPCIVTCHWNKTISSQRGLVGEGLCPHKGQKPSCSGTRCGVDTSKAHPVELGESSAEPLLPLSKDDSEQATALSAQLRSSFCLSCPLPHCRLFEYLIIQFAFPETELGEA